MATKKQAKTEATVQLWNNIRGSMIIWAKERATKYKGKAKKWLTFSTSIGKKNEDGEYDNIYFDVLFKKDAAPHVDEGMHEIIINKGFLTLSTYKDGSIHPAVMVLDYERALRAKVDVENEDSDEIPF